MSSFKKLSNEDFHMHKIGRGKWNDWHSVGFQLTERDQVIHEYEHVLISCGQIRCKECHDHAVEYIHKTSDYVYGFLVDYNLTNSEIVHLYNKWLYDFHCAANENSGKTTPHPSFEEVADYYLNFEVCEEGCTGH